MKRIALLALCAFALSGFRATPQRSAFVFAGEPLLFDGAMRPQFTSRQSRGSDGATRDGLARWAATPHGRAFIAQLDAKEFQVEVVEDIYEESAGRAPQPSLATLVAASNHTIAKSYEVILNPRFGVTRTEPLPGFPTTPADMMAVACAGEMLHVAFYARGISLPHHERDDFQREWREIAIELGYPSLQHGIEPERHAPRRRRGGMKDEG
jgi:hypothetical protein